MMFKNLIYLLHCVWCVFVVMNITELYLHACGVHDIIIALHNYVYS